MRIGKFLAGGQGRGNGLEEGQVEKEKKRRSIRSTLAHNVTLVSDLLEIYAAVVAPPDAGDEEAELLFICCWWHSVQWIGGQEGATAS